MTIISASGLSRTFTTKQGPVEAVRSIDLRVEPGEIVGFLGPNGAGKTTTLRMLTTLLPPTGGAATVVGCDLARDQAGVRHPLPRRGRRPGRPAGHRRRGRRRRRGDAAAAEGAGTPAPPTPRCRTPSSPSPAALPGPTRTGPRPPSPSRRSSWPPFSDTALIFGRYARQTLRSKIQILFGVLMPMLCLVFFGPLLTGLPLSDEGSSWQVLVPGLMLMLGLFGASFAGFAVVLEKNYGVIERMRVTPASRLALLLGRVPRDTLLFLFQSVLLILAAVAMGLRAPVAGVLIGFAFVALLTMSLASLSYSLGLRARTPQEFGPVINAVTMPSMLLSGPMLPMALAPGWLDVLSHFVPFRYLVDAVRAAFVGEYGGTTMLYGVLVAAAFAALSGMLGTRLFRRAGLR